MFNTCLAVLHCIYENSQVQHRRCPVFLQLMVCHYLNVTSKVSPRQQQIRVGQSIKCIAIDLAERYEQIS
jgi:hypothetical protein